MATKPLNILVNDRLQGIAGDFGPDTDGDFAVEGRKLAWVDTVDSKISNVLVNQMTVEQVEAIAETAIANAEATGDIAQQEWVNSQGFLKTVTTDGTTITGNGTTTSPLVAHSTMPTSVQNLLIENQLEVANRLVVDGSIVDVNGDQYPVASQTQYKLTAGDNITIDYANPRQPVISATGSSQYPTLVQKLFSGVSVIYAWKGDTTSTIIAKSSSAGTVSGSYIDSSDSTMYVFSVLPAGISFYLGNDSSENLFYTESILSIPATMEDLESKQDKLIAGENITIDGNTISATGGSSSNVTYNRSTGELTVDGTQVTVLNLGMGAIKADSITTTSIVEGLGGILAGSFLQNENGEDYILQKDVESTYVKKTDLVVDSIPMLNSTHLITSGGVYTPVQQVTTDLSTHKTTDKFRWQDTYDEQLLSIVRDGESQGLKLAGSFGGAEYPLTVTDEYGGIIAMQFINPSVSIFYTVYINGQLKYSSEGLPPNIPITKYMMVKNGDVVTSLNNPNILNYNYFVADTDSPFFKMVQQVTVNQQMIGSLQNDILNVKASIDNKVLDSDPNHIEDILNTTYIVSNSLGGRLNGIGYVLLGLLGVKLVATGTVDITYTNGTTIREYDNTALVGAGEANPFVLDVDAGTKIVSSGMAGLTFTPYIAK